MPQDYSGQNLRGRSFTGQDLTGANFSSADIRSTNFTGANLTGANFSHVKAGLSLYWVIGLLILLFFLAVLSGFTSEYVIDVLYSLSNPESHPRKKISAVATLLVLIFFFYFTIYKGLYPSLQISIFVSAIASSLITAIISSAFGSDESHGVAFAGVISAAIINAGIVDSACLILGLTKLNICNSVVSTFIFGLASFSGAIIVPTIIRSAHIFHVHEKRPENIIWYVNLTGLVIICIMLLSLYMAYNAMKGDERFALIHKISIVFATTGGTCFRNAILTETNFTDAILQNTDLRRAKLRKTYFYNVKGLDSVRSGENYLQNPQVRQVLVSRIGMDKNFDRQDLRGVNFKGANLEDASFIGADLSDSNLQQADLSRAKLVQTQLDGTNFIGATLTGAYIEDWGITRDTKFDGVRCEFVYMRLPTKENPDPYRKPDNREEVFANGEFGDFIKPIVDTLDLYHNQGVDPRAIAISFKQLTENHPDAELEIVAMEKRGEDKFLLRAKTGITVDKSELSAEYFDTYNQIKGLSEQEITLLLQEQGSKMLNLENMVRNLQSSNYYTTKTILILTANPKTTTSLRLDEEVREIDAGLKRAKKREEFNLEQRWAVRVRDVSQALLDFEPQIVHFSGHGSRDDGLVLEDKTGNVQLVNTVALAELFKLFTPNIECVLLNACYSEVQATAIVRHIPYVIGMNKEIGDKASIEFAIGFYTALGAGKSIEFSYEFGCSAIRLAGIPEHLTPVLKKKTVSHQI